jgi:hypothetical protein
MSAAPGTLGGGKASSMQRTRIGRKEKQRGAVRLGGL